MFYHSDTVETFKKSGLGFISTNIEYMYGVAEDFVKIVFSLFLSNFLVVFFYEIIEFF